jgi:hypothetical protein
MEGRCECGCGQKTKVAPYSWAKRGWIKGKPLRFINGHNASRIPNLSENRYSVEDRGYKTPCWIWQGRISSRYGQIRIGKQSYQAHRAYYEQAKGDIPEGLVLDHLCEVTTCVNPDHLEPVTQRENIRRAWMNITEREFNNVS